MRAQGEDAATFLSVFTEAVRHLEQLHGKEHVRWYDLLSFLLTWGTSRRPTNERQAILATTPSSQTDPLSRQELQAMAQTIAEGLIEEGKLKGELVGKLSAYREMLISLLTDQLGTLPQ